MIALIALRVFIDLSKNLALCLKKRRLSNVSPKILGLVVVKCSLDLLGPWGKNGRLLPREKLVLLSLNQL